MIHCAVLTPRRPLLVAQDSAAFSFQRENADRFRGDCRQIPNYAILAGQSACRARTTLCRSH